MQMQVSVASQLSFLAAKDARVAQMLSALDHVDPLSRNSTKGSSPSASSPSANAPEAPSEPCSGVRAGNDLELDTYATSSNRSKSSKDFQLQKLPLVQHLPDMLQTLSSLVLPLLPQLWEYFPSREHLQISSDRTARIVSVNSFERAEDTDLDETAKRFESGTALYPLISLINHSDSHNVHFLPHNDRAKADAKDVGHPPRVVLASRAISAGEELQICYTRDKNALKQKWNIGAGC